MKVALLAEVRLWDSRDRHIAAKVMLEAASPDAQEVLDALMLHIGYPTGRKRLEILWTWARVDRNRGLLMKAVGDGEAELTRRE